MKYIVGNRFDQAITLAQKLINFMKSHRPLTKLFVSILDQTDIFSKLNRNEISGIWIYQIFGQKTVNLLSTKLERMMEYKLNNFILEAPLLNFLIIQLFFNTLQLFDQLLYLIFRFECYCVVGRLLFNVFCLFEEIFCFRLPWTFFMFSLTLFAIGNAFQSCRLAVGFATTIDSFLSWLACELTSHECWF